MKLNHVVIVYKKPSHIRVATARQKSHLSTIGGVQKILKETGLGYRIILRDRMEARPPARPLKTDLIITVGGDGTVLSASHYAGNIPILGVNSMPKTSIGFFCAANLKNFKKRLSGIMGNRLKPKSLPLLQVTIDGKRLPFRALNDILFASASPAETVQYTIQAGAKKERQRGSGVWIAAGPGSTAGICSAGGKVSSISSEKIQFLARELYPIRGVRYKLKRGFVKRGGSIKITSEMKHGAAFLDGAKLAYPMGRGSALSVRVSGRKLRIFL